LTHCAAFGVSMERRAMSRKEIIRLQEAPSSDGGIFSAPLGDLKSGRLVVFSAISRLTLRAAPRMAELYQARFEGSTPEGIKIAWDFRDESWAGIDGLVRVNDPAAEPFRYLRLREPPYDDEQLRAFAETVCDPAYVYVRHEDEPTAPATVLRLREFLR